MVNVRARKVAYILFVENVRVLAHLGLLVSGLATNTKQARKIFRASSLGELVSTLHDRTERMASAVDDKSEGASSPELEPEIVAKKLE